MQFTEEQIDKLEVLFAQIHDSPQFNRHGLTLPRSPLDGSPFLWRTRDMHETSSWEFVFRGMRGVVWTIDLVCDPDFDTDEIYTRSSCTPSWSSTKQAGSAPSSGSCTAYSNHTFGACRSVTLW
jgi:hypothetical protein